MLTWSDLLAAEKEKDYFLELLDFVRLRRESGVLVHPPASDVFNAFSLTRFEDLKIVILGQDPYHGNGQAHGLSFSVKKGVKIPPSLKNIYKELCNDIEGFVMPEHGNLNAWAKQGVLLLNTVLTVEDGQAHSHKNKGWETFTNTVIEKINEHGKNIVFLLWGKPAQEKTKLINADKHHILTSVHPSPLSAHRGFLGCQHFSQANMLLRNAGKQAVDWQV